MLLYHFDGADDLLAQAVFQLRERRIVDGMAVARGGPAGRTLADRVRAMWPILVSAEARVLDQAIGLAMYDAERYADLGRGASRQYLPSLLSLCPADWSERRKLEVAEMILAVLRGFLVDARTSGDEEGIASGFNALMRALDREEAAGEWDDVVADLRADHRCVTPTLPMGAHRHPMGPDADLSLPALARLVAELLDRLDLFPPGRTGKTINLVGKLPPRLFGLFMQQMRLTPALGT